jgi:hypothetical protein
MMAFCYLLRIGEYSDKGEGTGATQTQPFKMKDVAFFGTNSKTGRLYRIHHNARDWEIMHAKCATLKLDNQKNGWKGVCVNHEANGDEYNCGVKAIGRLYCHIRKHTTDPSTPLFTYFDEKDQKCTVSNQDIREAIKMAATECDYPHACQSSSSIKLINTLRIGGACALALAGYSDTQIQKMGRWRGETFKEYVRENLSNYAEGMSKAMMKKHYFVNINSGTYTDVSSICETTAFGQRVAVAAC